MDEIIHQDQLMWSRTQWLVAIQAGAFAAMYSVRSECMLVWGVFVLALLLTVFLLFLVELDRRIRDEKADKPPGQGAGVVGPKTRNGQMSLTRDGKNRHYLAPLFGREIFWYSVIALILADIGLLVYLLQHIDVRSLCP